MSLRESAMVFFLFALCSCASLPALLLPTIKDDRLEAFIAEEAQQILRVSGNAHKAACITGRDLGLPLFISFRNYSSTAELAADETAMEYWNSIGWDCGIWIKLFRGFFDQGYTGDPERLFQAIRICGAESESVKTS